MKNKTHFLVLLLCLVYGIAAKAQVNQSKLLEDAKVQAKQSKSTTPLSNLIASGQLTEPRLVAMAYGSRAKLQARINKKYLRKQVYQEPIQDSVVLGILADYERAINACPICAMKMTEARYHFMSKTAPITQQYKEDLAKLKAAGLKPEQNGIMLSVHAWQRNGLWLGVSISPIGMIQPMYRLRYNDPETKKRIKSNWKTPLSLNTLTLGYTRKLDENLNDVSFSLIRIHAPIVLNLTTFGFQFGRNESDQNIGKRWFYRPEFGVGIGHFSISFGYDLFFAKKARQVSDKFFVQARFALVAN